MEVFYSGNAPELKLACKNLGIVHELSLPGVPQNNAMVERTNLDILEGTRSCLVCAGLNVSGLLRLRTFVFLIIPRAMVPTARYLRGVATTPVPMARVNPKFLGCLLDVK